MECEVSIIKSPFHPFARIFNAKYAHIQEIQYNAASLTNSTNFICWNFGMPATFTILTYLDKNRYSTVIFANILHFKQFYNI